LPGGVRAVLVNAKFIFQTAEHTRVSLAVMWIVRHCWKIKLEGDIKVRTFAPTPNFDPLVS
jgi:hypothetical protein